MPKSDSLSNIEIVTYVLAYLGGANKTVHSEDIAAKAYDLSPSRFCWRLSSYREKGWPDKYVVKTALEDAKKPNYGALVEGSYALDVSKDGWRLTPKGTIWFQKNKNRVGKLLNIQMDRATLPTRERQRFLKDIRSQPLYKEFSEGSGLAEASQYDFTDMLNCSPDASKDIITIKFNRYRSTARLVGDKKIVSFLDACKERFSDLLVREKGEKNGGPGQ